MNFKVLVDFGGETGGVRVAAVQTQGMEYTDVVSQSVSPILQLSKSRRRKEK